MLIRTAKGTTADIDDKLGEVAKLREGKVLTDKEFEKMVMADYEIQLKLGKKRDKAAKVVKAAKAAKRKEDE